MANMTMNFTNEEKFVIVTTERNIRINMENI